MANRKISYPRVIITLVGVIIAIFGIDYIRRNFTSTSNNDNSEPFSSSYVIMDTAPIVDRQDAEIPDNNSVFPVIDKSLYKSIMVPYDDIHKGELSLVNKTNPSTYPNLENVLTAFTYQKERKYRVVDYVNLKMCDTAAYSVESMLTDFYNDTGCHNITITSGYRDEAKQAEMLATYYSKDEPGFSEHHTGYAVDFKVVTDDMNISLLENTGLFTWIYENSYKYGLVQRYTEEKAYLTDVPARSYHFRYVGIPHAWYMHDANLCLEEYIEMLKLYTFGTRHLEISANDSVYEVYYIAAQKTGDTELFVPKTSEYSVSGNNIDGYIITVLKNNSQQEETTSVPEESVTETVSTESVIPMP